MNIFKLYEKKISHVLTIIWEIQILFILTYLLVM